MSMPPIVSPRAAFSGAGSTPYERAPLQRSTSADTMTGEMAGGPVGQPSRSSPAILAIDSPFGTPAPGALERLPEGALRQGDARWFTCPPTTPPPLAFYATVEGRTGYYEIDLAQCSHERVMDVLRQTRQVLAVQLPEQGLTAAMLRLLTTRCSALECLRLPCKTSVPTAELVRFLEATEDRLQAFCLGGRIDVFESPQLAAAATPAIKRMRQLKYLDITDGGASTRTTAEVKALLADKQLRGFSMAGNMEVDCNAVLSHPALKNLECLDLRRCTPQPGWVSSGGKRLVAAVTKLRHLRVLQTPPLPPWEDDAKPLEQLKAWAESQDLAFLRLGQGTAPLMIYDRRENAALAAAHNLPSEQWLTTFANWDPHFADVGRWCPPPRERWELMDLCKRGAVYILRELAALRGMGFEARVTDHQLEVEVTGPAYRLRWTLDSGHTFCVTVRPDELTAALDRLPVAKHLARQGSLASVSWLTASATATQLAQASLRAA